MAPTHLLRRSTIALVAGWAVALSSPRPASSDTASAAARSPALQVPDSAAAQPALPGETDPAALLQQIRHEADYILRLSLPDGAITSVASRDHVIPYHANLGAVGLARAYRVTRDERYATALWRWLEWYRDHQNGDGTIDDFRLVGEHWVVHCKPDCGPDSSDSYAGTYLWAALEAYRATGDLPHVKKIQRGIAGALDAVELTADGDGLHFARADWPFKYTMDEAEAYAGLRAAQEIGRALGDAALSARGRRDADALAAGASRLIDPRSGLYLWGLHRDGTRVRAPAEWIYPGASAQVWAVTFGLATGGKAASLVAAVDAAQPTWDQPSSLAEHYPAFCSGSAPDWTAPWTTQPCRKPAGYWPRFALAHIATGDVKRGLAAAVRIRDAADADGRPYPFTPADAGTLIQVFSDPAVLPDPHHRTRIEG